MKLFELNDFYILLDTQKIFYRFSRLQIFEIWNIQEEALMKLMLSNTMRRRTIIIRLNISSINSNFQSFIVKMSAYFNVSKVKKKGSKIEILFSKKFFLGQVVIKAPLKTTFRLAVHESQLFHFWTGPTLLILN